MCEKTALLLGSFAFAFFLSACSTLTEPDSHPVFQHGSNGVSSPWTDNSFDASDDKFTFAVFSDLTGGEREGIFEIAVAQLNLLRPEFIVNVGDLIDGGTDSVELNRQWDSFDARAGKARARVFYTGGNHDLLGEEMRAAWEERNGARYYHFVYRNVLFLVLDTEDHSPERLRKIADLRRYALQVATEQGWDAFDETEYANLPEDVTGAISSTQSEYMVKALADNPDVRWTFLLMHKSPWAGSNTPNWAAIEMALDERSYTVFHGHKHAYKYEQHNGRDHIRLATTGGVQMPEHGRSMDQVMLVTVDDEGVDIANLLMAGILDKTGHVPLSGDTVCFEKALCEKE